MSRDKQITVAEAKEIVPLVDIVKFNRGLIYLFFVKPQRLIGSEGVNPETINKLKNLLNTAGIRGVFIVADRDDFRIYELKPEE